MAAPALPTWLPMVAGSLCVAVIGLAGPAPASGPQVQARLVVPQTVAAGGKATITLEVRLGPGWHINGHQPLQSFLIPTTATLTTSGGTLSDVRYPEPVRRRFKFADEELAVYEGTVRFESELALPTTATGKAALEGVLLYQACNDSQCYPPAKTTVSATVAIAGLQVKGK